MSSSRLESLVERTTVSIALKLGMNVRLSSRRAHIFRGGVPIIGSIFYWGKCKQITRWSKNGDNHLYAKRIGEYDEGVIHLRQVTGSKLTSVIFFKYLGIASKSNCILIGPSH